MNIISKLSLLSVLCGLVTCNAESQLEINSFNTEQDRHAAIVSGYVITDQNDLLSVPEEFIHIHTLSHHLLEQHWLQNPNFIGDVTELKRLFRETQLPEAASFIATLEATKKRYLNNLDNVNAIANSMQREIDKDLDCYNLTIDKLQYKIQLLETPEETYQAKIQELENEIKLHSQHYSQLSKSLHQSLQQTLEKHALNTQLIHELKFNYEKQPHAICRQFKGMSELVSTIQNNCVYINRDQLLSAFPTDLKSDAEKIIDAYAPDIWQTMTRLNGYFDTSTNRQYFKNNLKRQLAKARQALREKKYIDEKQSTLLLQKFRQQLAQAEQKRNDTIDVGYLDQHFRIDTSSKAFVRLMENAQSPTEPFSEVYSASDIKQNFTDAYAKKLLMEYPAELYFTVSSNGLFSIPKQTSAQQLVFNFANNKKFLTYNVAKQSNLPHVIRSDSEHVELSSHSLLDELNTQLQKYWSSMAIASTAY
ncbi:hypothetical protein [uncultured Photobacterium sp.]|uniref:hypothetical protein n=1 Tax=uncultured Photobacterium sp. TaxID=173973 RepID=UPI00262C4190|nr:hypothetical protein [uncultured Photobacterium sp.]